MALGKLLIDMGANVAGFESDMRRAARVAKKESDRIKKQVDIAMKAVAASALAAGAGLATLVKKTANTADEIQKMSQRLGVSTEFLSQYRHVAELSGTSMEKVGDGVRKMSKSVNDANNGLSTAKRAFESLGISLDTLNSLSPEQQFELIADKISKVESQSVKAGAAMDIFGRSGSELLTVMNAGAEGIAAMRQEADSFGLTISQDAADGAAIFNDELGRLQSQLTGAAQSVAVDLLPEFTQLITEFRNSDFVKNFAENIKSMIGFFKGLSGEIEFAVKALAGLFIASKITLTWNVLSTSLLAAEAATKGMTIASATLNTTLGILKGTMALLGGPLGVIVLGAVALNEWVDATAEGRSHTDEFREANDKLAQSFRNLTLEQRKGQISETRFDLQDARIELDKIKEINAGLGIESNRVLRNAQASVDNLTDRLHKLKAEYVELLKPAETAKIEKTTAKVGKAIINNIAKPSEKAAKEIAKISKDFEGVFESLETPMEALNRQFTEQIEIIGRYMLANESNAEAKEKAAIAVGRLNKSYLEQREAIEAVLKPYDELIASLDAELFAMQANEQQLREMQAVQMLMNAGVIQAGQDLSLYSAQIEEVTAKLNALADASGHSFEIKIEGYKNLIGGFQSIADSIENAGEDVGKALSGLAQGFKQSIDGLAGISETFGDSELFESLGRYAEIAGVVGSALSFIDQISGGKLFGTDYETRRTTRSIDVTGGGAGGQVDTLQARQRSLFRGIRRRTVTSDLEQDTLSALDDLFESLSHAIQSSAASVGGIAGDLISGSFVEEFDKDGNLKSQISTVLGRTYTESFEEFARRLTAENILAGIGTVFDEVGQIANRWRGDAETLLDGSQFLLLAAADIQGGVGLFNELTGVATVIQDMSKSGESLVDTYTRVQGATLLLDDAFEVIGQSFEGARIDYVRLAADIAEAAGGLQEAQDLWSSYFETFYTEQELAARSLSSAITTRDSELSDIGLSSDISTEEFRRLFEEVLPTLSADAIVGWLEAANAIGVVIDLEADLNEQRSQNATDLAALIRTVNEEIENMGLSEFQLKLKDIRSALQENIRVATEMGATQRELAMIQAFATRQIEQALNALEGDVSNALTDMYGTELDRINEQIALIESQQGAVSNLQSSSDNLYESQLRAIQNIAGFLDSILLNEQLSPLNPQEQLAEAQSQFDELLLAAQGGDVDALNSLPAMAQSLLGFGQDVFASSQDYVDIFNSVTDSLSGLGVTAAPTNPNQGGQIIGQNAQLIELMAERNRLEEAFNAEERLHAAREIAKQLGDIASVTGESFAQLAERLNIPVSRFLGDLGINLENVTDRTVNSLSILSGDIGQNLSSLVTDLGLDLSEFATSIGLDLGSLQSSLGGSLTEIDGALIDSLGELSNALGVDLSDLTGALSGDLSAFSEALGIDLSSIDATTATALQSVATALGTDLTTLAQSLGIDLSALDQGIRESLNGVSSALIELPGEFQGPLPEDPTVTSLSNIYTSNVSIRDEMVGLRTDETLRENETAQFRQDLLSRFDTFNNRLQTVEDIAGVA